MEQPDIFVRATFWALSNPASLPRSGMIELVEAAGLARSPLMDAVIAQLEGMFTTPSEVVTSLLRFRREAGRSGAAVHQVRAARAVKAASAGSATGAQGEADRQVRRRPPIEIEREPYSNRDRADCWNIV